MPGGNSKDRRKFRRAVVRAACKLPHEDSTPQNDQINKSMPNDTSESKRSKTTEIQAFILAVVGIALTITGYEGVIPSTVNVLACLVALAAILWAIGRWESAASWGTAKKVSVQILVTVLYCSFMKYPLLNQYNKELNINVSFKDSPEMSWGRKQIIIYDLSGIQRYLSSLGIPVPKEFPPITTDTRSPANQSGWNTRPGLPLDRGSMSIAAADLRDRKKTTAEYTSYVFLHDSQKLLSIPPDQGLAPLLLLSWGFSGYFNASYWNKRDELFVPPGKLLWKLRENLGIPFTDRLAAAAFRTLADDPSEIQGENIDIRTVRALMLGDSIVESECDRWPSIRDVLVKNGIPKDAITTQTFTQSSEPTACTQKWAQ